MMAADVRPAVNRASKWTAAIGSLLGLAWVCVLIAFGIRDYLRHPDGGIPIFSGILVSAIWLAPFAGSLLALIKGSRRFQVAAWCISGLVASVLALFSPGGVAVPLAIPAGLLLIASITGDVDR